jgi:hypothetical protein
MQHYDTANYFVEVLSKMFEGSLIKYWIVACKVSTLKSRRFLSFGKPKKNDVVSKSSRTAIAVNCLGEIR